MLVAFLSDVHGNGAALDAVLADLPPVDALLCAGDLVGYYPDAPAVVDRLRALGARAVRGNHDLMVCGRRPVPADRAPLYRTAWTRRVLSPDQLAWLDALPPSLELTTDGVRITLRHASPWDEETYVYPDSAALPTIELGAGHWMILGHTHYPMLARCGAGWLANPGSVGQPRDWDPRAAYALLDTQTGDWRQCRVEYDHPAYQRRLEALGWERQTIELLSRTRVAVREAV